MTTSVIPWKSILLYCILAYALLWIPFFISLYAKRKKANPERWEKAFSLLGPFSPLLAAIIVRTLITQEGFNDAHLGLSGVGWVYWLLALALPFFWNGVQDALYLLLGFAEFNWCNLLRYAHLFPLNLLGAMPIFLGEEFGWRSFLLQKLLPLGRWEALLISGLIWSLWHAPLVFIPNPYYSERRDVRGAIMGSAIFVLFGFIFGWLYLESGSVWTTVLMHSYNNQIGLKLFRWEIRIEPTPLQQTSMAILPVLLVWAVLFLSGAFT